MQVAKWGNSLAVRLPHALVKALGLKEGDEVEVRVANSQTLEIGKAPTVEDILSGVRQFRGRAPTDYKFNRLDAYERK